MSYNLKNILSLHYHFYLFLLLIQLFLLILFYTRKKLHNFSNRYHTLIVLHFLFHGLLFSTILRVLKPVLCFHMASFHYSTKGVWDVDSACRCHQSNIKPDSIFSINIAQWVTCCLFVSLYFVLFVYYGVIFRAPFIRRDRVLSFITIILMGLGKL